ncbi:ABC transporter substrate-binding protein [Tianweitania sp. BSSL-BM11]|uniref:ABC transporter substrate-binding protein n=1 Tax=Tianweitania aestuarii TaxID=2814886 RepID=A0ABS5RRB5_9HYPH|nr:extracellular solute-binding protein [Tianweitania aestuarii]MBS9719330.1 ABC transporter substrate-binding protein [Tianweitania aestuarii]
MRFGASIPRRSFLALTGAAVFAPAFGRTAFAAAPTDTPMHGLSAFGALKYPPEATQLDYASPDAPSGGTFNFTPSSWYFNQNTQTFNTLNSFILRGDAPPRMELCFDSLMGSALDEPDALYGLVAETVSIAADRNSWVFKLRPQARFHDGTPITPEDVAASYMLLKDQGHPDLALPLVDLRAAEVLSSDTVRLVFDGNQSPRAILAVATYPILSRANIEERGGFDNEPMTPLLGSGPYKVGQVQAGQTIEYERLPDYWGRDLLLNKGLDHFDRIRIEFYRERQAAFEAFKKGEILFRQEYTSRVWATGYNFPAINDGRVAKREFPSEKRPTMQAWAVNQRRNRFKDARVREAIGLCFDFEWTNRNLFYDGYVRSNSLFELSDFRAEGTPQGEELALLELLRSQLPPSVFGDPVMQPRSNGSGRDRALLSRAQSLLTDAGFERRDGFLQNRDGERLTIELLVNDDGLARRDAPLVENMRAIGIDASVRLVDPAQYQARQASFDFDMISVAASFTATPTRDEMETFFHSKTANREGSRNLPGTADPAVDALIDAVGRAETREMLVVAMRALDRVLRARRDWIPQYYLANHRASFWDMFGFKEPKPDYGFPVERLWWVDPAKAKAIGKA